MAVKLLYVCVRRLIPVMDVFEIAKTNTPDTWILMFSGGAP